MTVGWPAALGRRFTPLEVLGSGAFGTVFKARDAQGGVVALKVLRDDRKDALRQFKREFRALADLAHEHLVGLYELSCEGDQWFLVMEWLDGVDLPFVRDPVQARRALAQVARGLEFLHREGRLHRDLKPSNVRLTASGRAVVLDFGFALDGPESADEGFVGTAAYLSPEQAAGDNATPQSDLYALGVMLFEQLTGRRPFEGTVREVLVAKRRGDAPKVEGDTGLEALCAALLSRDPGLRPGADVVAATLDPSSLPQRARRFEVPLVGREASLAAMRAAFEDSQRGPVAVWVRGAAGLGKSALLRAALAQVEAADAVVFQARCFEHETVPCKAIDALVDGLARWVSSQREDLPAPLVAQGALLARLFPVLAQVPAFDGVQVVEVAAEQRLRAAAVALREVLAFVAGTARLVVVVDDLHWADADSLPFLLELLSSAAPFLFVGAYRDEVASPVLEALRHLRLPSGGAVPVDVALQPLGEADAQRLAQALSTGAEGLEGVVREAQGNPLLLQQFAEFAGEARATGQELDLSAAVQHRVARLSEEARRLLGVICLFGAPLPPGLWDLPSPSASGERGRGEGPNGAPAPSSEGEGTPTDPRAALAQLRASRLIKSGPHATLEPYHDQIRHVVDAGLSASERTTHHARIADALLRAPVPDPDQLAHHLAGADRLEPAAAWALQSAERALRSLAFHHAAQQYEKSLRWAPHQAGARRLRVAQAEALALAGRGAEAAERYLGACDGADAAERLDLERRAGAQLLRNGHIERGLGLTRTSLSALGLRLPQTLRGVVASLAWSRGRLRFRRAGVGFVERTEAEVGRPELERIDALVATSIGLAAVDSLRAQDLMSQALLRALDAGEPGRVAVCLGFETAFLGNGGGATEPRTRALIAAAEVLTQRLGSPYARGCALGGAGIAFFHLGHLDEARRHCEAAAELFEHRCPGAVKEFFTNQLFTFASLAQGGELAELGRRVPGALRQAIERGDRYAEAHLRTGVINLAWLAVDDVAAARAEADAALPGLETRGYSVQHFFDLLCRFHLAQYEGDAEGVQRVLEAGLPPLEHSMMVRVEWIAVARAWMQGRAAVWRGDRRAALRAAAVLAQRGRPWVAPMAITLRADVARLDGDELQALALFRAAATGFEGAELKLHAVSARLAVAELVGGDEGRALMASAKEAAARLGVRAPEKMARLHAGR